MTNTRKTYKTPKGEVVTMYDLIEVPPVRTAEDVVRNILRQWRVPSANQIVAALRDADMLKEPEQPDDGWIPHDGGPCPVGDEQLVDVRFRSGSISTEPVSAGYYVWEHQDFSSDIIAYRIKEDK